MKRFALTSALILAFAAPGFANEQLARNLGVEPGVYETHELIQLAQAREDGNRTLEAYILGGGAEVVSTQSFETTVSNDQMARSLGVEPGMYSTPELILLAKAREDGDKMREKHILGGGVEVVSTQSFGYSAGADGPGVNATARRIFAQISDE